MSLAAFAEIRERFGAVDILVNSAGIAHIGNVEMTTEEDLDRIYAVNVKGVYNCLMLGVVAMKGSGGVILESPPSPRPSASPIASPTR